MKIIVVWVAVSCILVDTVRLSGETVASVIILIWKQKVSLKRRYTSAR